MCRVGVKFYHVNLMKSLFENFDYKCVRQFFASLHDLGTLFSSYLGHVIHCQPLALGIWYSYQGVVDCFIICWHN